MFYVLAACSACYRHSHAQTLLILQIQFPAWAARANYGRLCLHRRFYTRVNCCCSKLIGYTRGAVTFKGAVIYQILRYNTCLGSVDVQERNWLFKGLFSLVDVTQKIRKEAFYLKLFVVVGLRQILSAKVTGYH